MKHLFLLCEPHSVSKAAAFGFEPLVAAYGIDRRLNLLRLYHPLGPAIRQLVLTDRYLPDSSALQSPALLHKLWDLLACECRVKGFNRVLILFTEADPAPLLLAKPPDFSTPAATLLPFSPDTERLMHGQPVYFDCRADLLHLDAPPQERYSALQPEQFMLLKRDATLFWDDHLLAHYFTQLCCGRPVLCRLALPQDLILRAERCFALGSGSIVLHEGNFHSLCTLFHADPHEILRQMEEKSRPSNG